MPGYTPDPRAAVVPPDPLLEASALRARLSPLTAHELALGAALFQRGLFWEAHEIWEAPWTREEGETRHLLQAVILIAAAFHKAREKRHTGGCVRLLTRAIAKLTDLGARQGGLDLIVLRSGAVRALALAVAWHEGRGEPPARADAPELRPD